MTNVMHKFFSMFFISIYNSLHVFYQPAHISATNTEWLLPGTVFKQFVSPDDELCVLERFRDL